VFNLKKTIMDYSDSREFFKPFPPVFVMQQLDILSKLNLTEEELNHLAAVQAECLRSIMQAQADCFRQISEMLVKR